MVKALVGKAVVGAGVGACVAATTDSLKVPVYPSYPSEKKRELALPYMALAKQAQMFLMKRLTTHDLQTKT